MKIKRFTCFVLSLLLMFLSGRFSAFAATASESNAIKPKFYIAGLKAASSGSISAVVNTIDSTNVIGKCFSQPAATDANLISGSSKHLGSTGFYSFINSSVPIKVFTFDVPQDSLPTSGSYMFSYSFNSDVAYEIDRVSVWLYKSSNNAATGNSQMSSLSPNHINNAGEFRLDPILVDFRQVTRMRVVCVIKDSNVTSVSGNFHVRYEVSNQTGGAEMGFTQSTEDSSAMTAQNTTEIAQSTSELVYSQNETNGLLRDIIQHISDQLAAMWDQIAGYLITPWMQQDRDLHDETIETLEDLNTEQNNTIVQETEWHANFIIDGLKSLFIPSDTYFQTTIEDLMNWFEQRLGFLGYTLTYLIRLLNGIMNAPQNPVIRFPGIHAPNRATNEDYVLLPAMDVNLADQISMINDGCFNLLEFLRTAGDIVLVLAFIVLLQDKLHEVES